MKALVPDLIHAWRVHRSTPVASSIAVVVLGIALGFMTAFLSLFSDLLPQPHRGFDDANGVATLVVQMPEHANPVNTRFLERAGDEVSGFAAVAGVNDSEIEWRNGARVESLTAEMVTRGFFDGLRPRLVLGDGIANEDHREDGASVAVISHALWQRRFGGRPDVIDKELALFAEPMASNSDEPVDVGAYRIIGVAHPDMDGTFGSNADLWLPAEQFLPKLLSGRLASMGLGNFSMFRALARIAPDRSLESAQRELAAAHGNGRFDGLGIPPDDVRMLLYPGVTQDPGRQAEARRQVGLFALVGLLVVVVAGANVGLFLLARAPGRKRELGIRLAVGAPMKRLRRQLLVESALLVAAATLVGIVLALWLMVGFQDLAFLERARFSSVSLLDWRVLAGVVGVTALATLLVSLAPIAGLKRLGVIGATRQVRARPGMFQRFGGALQIAIAGVVACVALGFVLYLLDLGSRDLGYSTDDLVVISPAFGGTVFSSDSGDSERTRVRRERQRQALVQIPGVEAVAFGSPVPAGQVGMTFSFRLSPPDRPDQDISVALASADPAYPELLDLRVLHGRWPDAGDESGHVVSRALAEAVFGHVDVVGEVLPPIQGPGLSEPRPVVAVVENVFFAHPEKPDDPRIYSESTFLSGNDRILMKTRLPLETLRRELDRLIEAGELEIEIQFLFRPRDRFRELLAPDRGRLALSVLAAVTALALALFGFYGIQRFLVDAGRREFAILAAIGAGPKRLRRRVIGTGLLLGLPGLVFAAPLGYLALAALQPEFLPDSIAALAIVVFVVAALAALLVLTSLAPARRAAAIARLRNCARTEVSLFPATPIGHAPVPKWWMRFAYPPYDRWNMSDDSDTQLQSTCTIDRSPSSTTSAVRQPPQTQPESRQMAWPSL